MMCGLHYRDRYPTSHDLCLTSRFAQRLPATALPLRTSREAVGLGRSIVNRSIAPRACRLIWACRGSDAARVGMDRYTGTRLKTTRQILRS